MILLTVVNAVIPVIWEDALKKFHFSRRFLSLSSDVSTINLADSYRNIM